MSFTNRIFLSLGLIALILIFLAHVLYQSQLESIILEDVKSTGSRQLELVGGHILGQQDEAFDHKSLQDRLVELGKTLNARLTYIDRDGRVLADSGVSRQALPKMDDHSTRPEVQEAERTGLGFSRRYSTTQHIELVYLARRIDLPGLPPGYLRLAKPQTQIEWLLAGTGWRLAGLVAAGLLLTACLGWLLTRRLQSEVNRISAAAENIDSEEARRIDFPPLRELVPFVRSINRLSKKAQTDYRIIAEQRDELEAVLNGMQEGVLLLNARGGVIKANKAAEKIFAIPFDTRGRKPIELIRCPELQAAVEEMLKSGSRNTERLLITLPEQRFFDTSLIPVSLTSESAPQMIIVLHDVSELKRLEQVRKDFIANISHELRTPLTSIKGYTETLLSSPQPDPATLESFMQVIQKNVNTMTHLLENLLQLARLESEHQKTSLETVDAKTAFAVAWEICAPLAKDKAIRLINDLPDREIQILARHEQLVRVWINLLDNAVKYSPKQGDILVSAGEEGLGWVFSVQDEGPGIPRKDQDRIFERFYRVDASRNGRDIPGTGLGLAICKHILQRHQGSIWVTSPVPETLQGSIFSFRLPKPTTDRTRS